MGMTQGDRDALISRVLIVGAGTMGRGVARSFADHGFSTVIWSRRAAALSDLPRGVTAVATLPPEAPDLVIENVTEDAAIKREVFQAIESAYSPPVIIATNTSGLPLDELASGLARPQRFLGTHYFQPADVCPMVEVVAATATEPEVVDQVATAMRRAGKDPILVRKPVPGYLVNRLQHAILHEAYHLIAVGAASAAEIDRAAKQLLGPRMCVTGLIEQKDISGLETHARAQAALVPVLTHAAEPAGFVQEMVARGETGLASGFGFYDWSGCNAAAVSAQAGARLKRVLALLAEAAGEPAPNTVPRERKLPA
ncbi:MAG TPA: 3-hydroxyacyl-CoA dehydrogenase NAD-binding domain-containing protein [Alphaproteobacteria bacterium]|nr:3-hydroxyacyl-CoA dehydrogenase NAD-binding domain-containing protein [Alphaproteobacteria bacterium]